MYVRIELDPEKMSKTYINSRPAVFTLCAINRGMVKYVLLTTSTYYQPHVYFLNMNYRSGASITDT